MYFRLSTELACISDQALQEILRTTKSIHSGMGGTSFLATIDETPIFIKKIALTDLERRPENGMSTRNLFDLPLSYQYGIGSAGFGGWRELAAHTMTTNWVLSDQCPNFPILYHWRVLPSARADKMKVDQLTKFEDGVKYWEDVPSIRNRLRAIHYASAHIYLFLEYFPENAHTWLAKQIGQKEFSAAKAISLVESDLHSTNAFMKKQDFLHFDAHFNNLLTDGKSVYYTDFGLSTSLKFLLSKEETEFFHNHRNYDECSSVTNLLHCIITTLFGKEQWEIRLQEFLDHKLGEVDPAIDAVIRKYAPIALTMDGFYQEISKVNKSTPFPKEALDELLAERR